MSTHSIRFARISFTLSMKVFFSDSESELNNFLPSSLILSISSQALAIISSLAPSSVMFLPFALCLATSDATLSTSETPSCASRVLNTRSPILRYNSGDFSFIQCVISCDIVGIMVSLSKFFALLIPAYTSMVMVFVALS